MARRRNTSASRSSMPRRSASTSTSAPKRNASKPNARPSGNVPAAARPQQSQPVPMQMPQQEGLFGRMASTAAGVAVGHSVGHAITGMFSGGSGSRDAQEQAAQPGPQSGSMYPETTPSQCEPDSKAFVRCMESTHNDFSACQVYYDMLQSCMRQTSMTGVQSGY